MNKGTPCSPRGPTHGLKPSFPSKEAMGSSFNIVPLKSHAFDWKRACGHSWRMAVLFDGDGTEHLSPGVWLCVQSTSVSKMCNFVEFSELPSVTTGSIK